MRVGRHHPAFGSFVPVIASLRAYERAIRQAGAGTHLASIRPEYLRVCSEAATLGTVDW